MSSTNLPGAGRIRPGRNWPVLISLLAVWLCWLPLLAYAANISVRADRNPVNVQDTFQLVFSSDAEPDDDPDFAPLETDFDILNQSTSQQFQIINGQSSRNVQWTLTLSPKRTGELAVPPIAFGNDRSQPLTVTVRAAEDPQPMTGTDAPELFLQAEASPAKPYVQAQLLYTVRFYRRVDIAQAALSDPALPDAVVEKLGEDSTYRSEWHGQPYIVTERKFAIFPQHSGALRIPPLTLDAQVVVGGNSGFGGFFGRQATRAKRVLSNAVDVEVLPQPAEFTGSAWLAAEQLQLQEQWSGALDAAQAGEPLTRTLRLVAKGVAAGSLPELGVGLQGLQAAGGGKLKAYPDQPAINEQKNPDGIIASREEKIALIPTQAGDYPLPEITIPWWNTKTQRMEIARVPAQTLHANPSAEPSPAPAAAPVMAPTTPPAATVTGGDSATQGIATTAFGLSAQVWMGVALLALGGWLATGVYTWRHLHKRTATVDNTASAPRQAVDTGALIRSVQSACRANNQAQTRDALLAWARAQYACNDLAQLAKRCAEPLCSEILALQRCLYAPDAPDWDGNALSQAFAAQARQTHAPKQRQSPNDALEPLYKI